MSAQILTENTLARMGERLNEASIGVMNLRYSAATGATVNNAGGGAAGSVLLPASTAEQIGLQAVEINAYRRGMQDAADILRHELQQLIAPDGPVPANEKGNGKAEHADPIY
jgi:hypothetical protein